MSGFLSSSDDTMHRYLFEYRHDGAEYGIEILARSPSEAKERINALNFARYKGEVVSSITIPSAGLIGRIIKRIFGI